MNAVVKRTPLSIFSRNTSPRRSNQMNPVSRLLHSRTPLSSFSLPKAVDWRNENAVTAVKNQRNFGNCWAFGVVGAVEGINKIVTGNLVDLSPQHLIDCDPSSIRRGGGCPRSALEFIIANGGIHKSVDYPYRGRKTICKEVEGKLITIDGIRQFPVYSKQSLFKAIAKQPVVVSVFVDYREFHFYTGGIFTALYAKEPDHAMLAVGYEISDDGEEVIILKNSWGQIWGEDGYMRMSVTQGWCGVDTWAYCPIKFK